MEIINCWFESFKKSCPKQTKINEVTAIAIVPFIVFLSFQIVNFFEFGKIFPANEAEVSLIVRIANDNWKTNGLSHQKTHRMK